MVNHFGKPQKSLNIFKFKIVSFFLKLELRGDLVKTYDIMRDRVDSQNLSTKKEI